MRALAAVLLSVCWMSVHAALKTTWDVGDYVQDGIIMHYDGIRNVGAGLPHDSQAEQWVDLSPTAGRAVNRACKYGGAGSWTDKSYFASGVACMETVNEVALGSNFTIQIACELDVTSDDRTHPAIFGIGSDNFAIRMDRSFAGQQALTNVHWKVSKDFTGAQHVLDFQWHDGLYINAGANDEYLLFTNGTDWAGCEKTYGTGSPRENVELPAAKYFIGGNPYNANNGKYCTIGHYYAVRAYSRMLTKEELAWNRAIDEIRFHGATAAPCTNVVVAAAVAGRPDGAEIPGVYVVDGSHTFTAAATSCGGNSFAPLGYTLETWDAEAGDWGEAVYSEGAAYVYDTAATDAMVRLAWVWEQTSGIRRYDVGDYVQEGLVAHYDAIRNAGADRAQDPSATVWKDLSPNAGQATRGLSIYAGNPGSWASNAYVFEGESYWRMDTALALGVNFTIQIACQMEVDSRKTGRIYPTPLWGKDNWLFQMDRKYETESGISGTNIYWNTSAYDSGERPVMQWLDGKYINAAFGDTHKYWTPYADWTIRYLPGRAESRNVDEIRYVWGGKMNQGEDYAIFGRFHSLRMYSRVLTNEELAKNRDVDEVRFHGAAPTWSNSVWVVSSRPELPANESGAYFLDGGYVFTAPERVVAGDDEFYPAGSVVEKWNAAEKKWTDPVYVPGASRRLEASASTVARRLTWRWTMIKGLRIFVR